MLEAIAILLFGLIPGMLSSYFVTTGVRRYSRQRRYAQQFYEIVLARRDLPLQAQDYRYVEGLGYIVGDLSCQFNARSPHIRCAVNPSGPCNGCLSYEAIQFPEEQDESRSLMFRRF